MAKLGATVGLAFLLMISSGVIAQGSNADSSIFGVISHTYSFAEPVITKISIAGDNYHQVGIEGLSNGGEVGHPVLPSYPVRLLLPPQKMVKDVRVSFSSSASIKLDYPVVPAAESVPLSQVALEDSPSPDPLIYDSDEPFPEQLLNEVGVYSFRGYSIVILNLYPVQYSPARNELVFHDEIAVSVELEESDERISSLYRGVEADSNDVLTRVDNPEVLGRYGPPKTNRNDDYDLLILTVDEFVDSFIPLKDAHDAKGNPTAIRTLTDVGSSDTVDIRSFIRDAYLNWGIEYVLIGGDADIVPVQLLAGATELPSDLFYACLDGPFNWNDNDWWGEPTDGENGGDVDLIAEVYVGRAPVGAVNEVENFVEKTLSYLRSDGCAIQEHLLTGEILSHPTSTYGGDYMDELINGATTHGYTTTGIPKDYYDIDKLYDRDGYWDESDIMPRLNRGSYFISDLGHSSRYRNLKIYPYLVEELTNTRPFFVYSQGCDAGDFVDELNETDSIAEIFTVKTRHGAFAGIWNSGVGYYKYRSTDGDSQRFHREFWDAVYGEELKSLGRANQDSKEDNLYRINERSSMRSCYYQLNVLGDPLLDLGKACDLTP